MLAIVHTCVLYGLEGYAVEVETDVSRGMPVFNIVGLPDTAIKESKERVRSAVINSGYEFPISRITVNLSPANLKKEGSQIDLSIAVGILMAADVIKESADATYFLGELSLDGRLNPIDGALPMVIALREKGVQKIILPEGNAKECCVVSGVDIFSFAHLNQVVDYLNGSLKAQKCPVPQALPQDGILGNYELDFSEIKGQENLKRALEIAAAGGHNILMIGPPGSGKTMIARRLPTIMPPLQFEEALEVTKIYSVAGLLSQQGLIGTRPFRAPHHTLSSASLVGGGRIPMPGEVSLAHQGVLFLDELPEFGKHVLEVLRQPLEDGQVSIARVHASITYPSQFMLVAAMNPCPCGYLGDSTHRCSCSEREIKRYLSKISGPLLDRVDIHIQVNPVKYEDIQRKDIQGERSESIRNRVIGARNIQNERYRKSKCYNNAQLKGKHIEKYCELDEEGKQMMALAFDKLNFSTRAYHKVLKVARTIADLDGEEHILARHLAEAIQYRRLDKKYWAR